MSTARPDTSSFSMDDIAFGLAIGWESYTCLNHYSFSHFCNSIKFNPTVIHCFFSDTTDTPSTTPMTH
jgi:hypothetical protein